MVIAAEPSDWFPDRPSVAAHLHATEAVGLSISLLALGCLIPLIWRSRQLAAWLGLLSSSVGVFLLALAGVLYGSDTLTYTSPIPGPFAASRIIEVLGVLTAIAGLVALSFIADNARRRKRLEQSLVDIDIGLAMSGKSLGALLDSTADALIVAKIPDETEKSIDIESVRVSEHAEHSVVGDLRASRTLDEVQPAHLRRTIERLIRKAKATGLPAREKSDSDGDASHLAVWAFASETTALVRVTDVTAQTRLENELQSLAYTDALTGLANRRCFEAFAKQVADRSHGSPQLSIAYLDLNGFKEVNDAHGHKRGDAVLVEFAQRLLRVVEEHFGHPDTRPLTARLGGDEFVVILEGVDATRLHAFAEHLYHTLAEPYGSPAHAVHCPASIGVVSLAGELESLDVLLQHADAAMYAAKFSSEKSLVIRLDAEHDGDEIRRRRKSDWQLDQDTQSVRRA